MNQLFSVHSMQLKKALNCFIDGCSVDNNASSSAIFLITVLTRKMEKDNVSALAALDTLNSESELHMDSSSIICLWITIMTHDEPSTFY